jgi:hypothetical protein
MNIEGAAEALDHVGSWARRKDWTKLSHRVIDEHLAPVCSSLGISQHGLADLFGEELGAILGCAFFDFLTRRFGPEGRNAIDDYLDRFPRRDPPSARDYLRALRNSTVSIFEVVEVKPDRRRVFIDLVRGAEPIEPADPIESDVLVKGTRIAARVLLIAGGYHFTAVLVLLQEAADTVLRILRASPEQARRIAAAELASLASGRRRVCDDLFGENSFGFEAVAPVVSWMWLAQLTKHFISPQRRRVVADAHRARGDRPASRTKRGAAIRPGPQIL